MTPYKRATGHKAPHRVDQAVSKTLSELGNDIASGHNRAPASAQQAALLRPAIANYRKLKKLLRSWELETERLIDAEAPNAR